MLTYAEMLPVPKAWVSYVVQTLESASCTSEIPLKRVLAAYAIIKGHPIDIGRLLANSLHDLATGNTTQLGHGSLINWLCEQQLVPAYDSDLNTSNMKPIILAAITPLLKISLAHSWLHCTHHNNTGIKADMAAAAAETPPREIDPLYARSAQRRVPKKKTAD